MCGIAAVFAGTCAQGLPPWPFRRAGSPGQTLLPPVSDLLAVLARRGPDASGAVAVPLPPSSLHLLAATLSLRHAAPLPHPYPLDPDAGAGGPLLLYNGELYDFGPADTAASDTRHLADVLRPLLSAARAEPHREAATLAALDDLRGPYALIGWAPGIRRLYFARDPLGRRSLLVASVPGVGTVVASAVPRGFSAGFAELPPAGLCFLDLSDQEAGARFGLVPRPSRPVAPRELRPATAAGEEERRLLNRSFLPQAMSRSCVRAALMSPDAAVDEFLSVFERSMRRRIVLSSPSRPSGHPSFAVLFSGGLDSLLVAVVLDRVLPPGEPFDLVNVAFGADSAAIAGCPDRVSAVQGYRELLQARGGGAGASTRPIRLFCVDVPPHRADEALESSVRHLVHPCDQPMDASIGTALWLAARARGYVYPLDGRCGSDVRTLPARVLFSGLGADELAGGYKGRHRTSYRLGGAEAVEREIDADLGRLWCRNLGRDDRLISDCGREVRHPFLDEDLIRLVARMPLVDCVCDLSLPDGVGDKQLLRRAAARLGLGSAACGRPKRAIQFGSRSKHVLERRRGPPVDP
jgi:asparagine synthetase B (glutamine-hydrolysing)